MDELRHEDRQRLQRDVPDHMTQEKLAAEVVAGGSTVGSWALWGWSLSQVNELLQAISFVAATIASIAATIYYLRNRKK